MTDRLQKMYDMQRELQKMYNDGRDVGDFSLKESIAEIFMNAYALQDELHEAVNETSWKPWVNSVFLNREAYKGELVDAFHFFMNMMLHAGITPEELYMGYLAKNQRNYERQAKGYDGVSTKCPGCKRDFGDVDAARGDTDGFASRYVVAYEGFEPQVFCRRWCFTDWQSEHPEMSEIPYKSKEMVAGEQRRKRSAS